VNDLFSKPITVHDGAGIPAGARLAVCPTCACEQFLAYTVHQARHIHFQCLGCGASYCDGRCVQDHGPAAGWQMPGEPEPEGGS
jgi:hypothetical protein